MPPTALTDHYSPENLIDVIRDGLREAGADPDAPTPDDLKPVDEFHTGGIEATEYLLAPLGISRETRVLDVGSGIGGTARFIAETWDAHVTGVDLTPGFVNVARELSRMCGLGQRTEFLAGSALGMPVASSAHDLAVMMHVGMNIEDKTALFREVARTLAPGGRFAIFDIMRGDDDLEINFPAPWSPDAANSFVSSPEVYRSAGMAAGLRLQSEEDRSDFANTFFRRVVDAMKDSGPPPVGLHLLMGDGAQERYTNAVQAALSGATAPWQMIFEKPGG